MELVNLLADQRHFYTMLVLATKNFGRKIWDGHMKKRFGLFSRLPIAPMTKLVRDERGSILLQFTVYVLAILGMIGLALDGGRYLLLNNDLQDLADAAAIAGAAELDGTSNALTRADTAARTLLTNNPRWSDSGSIRILAGTSGVQFYSQINPDTVTTDPRLAKYVKVTTGAWQVAPWFLPAVTVLTGTNIANNSTGATAMAGITYTSCGTVSSFICHPFENTESVPGRTDNFPGQVQRGWMFRLRAGSGAAGDWGIINVPGETSNLSTPQDITAFLSRSAENTCNASRLTPRPGNIPNQVADGFNVRFDRPVTGVSGVDNTAAAIVIDGVATTPQGATCQTVSVTPIASTGGGGPGGGKGGGKGGGGGGPPAFDPNNYSVTCNSKTDPTQYSCPLPRDRTITNNIGSGPHIDDLQAYWLNHHGTATLPSGVTTRYDIYNTEIGGTKFTSSLEASAPQCLPLSSNPSRRIVKVAIVPCTYWGITGASQPDVLFTKYAEFFITEPSTDGTIYSEYIRTFSDGSGDLHRTVQLVR
jgi:Flp pilus assembly protein TadG